MKKLIYLTVAGLLAGAVTLFAQMPGGGFPGGGFPGEGGFPGGGEFKMPELPPLPTPEEKTAEMAELLKLSEEQKTALLELNRRYDGKLEYRPEQQEFKDIREMSEAERQEFFEKSMAQAQDREKVMAEIEENNKMYDNALKALLDKKQFRAYQKEKRRKEIEERRRFESMFMGGPGGFGGFGGGFGGPGGGFGGPGGF